MKSIYKYGLLAAILFFTLPLFVGAQVVINEIAWMGMLPKEGETSQAAANNEWLELFNSGAAPVSLDNWKITSEDGMPDIILSGTISAGGYFLLERGNDDIVPNISADIVYPYKNNTLSNTGEKIILKNATGEIIDQVDGSDNWKIGGVETIGNNTTKETAQRTSSGDWITAAATPKAANAGSTTLSQQSQTSTQSQSSQASASQPPAEQPQPQLNVNAGEDKTAFSGQNVIFRAVAYGLEGKPLENANYSWNLGDGGVKSGNPASYIYKYPGEYRVVLSVYSGILSGSDDLKIKIIQPSLEISELKSGQNGFVEVHNFSSIDLDISGLGLSDTKNYFYFPENTEISAKGYLTVAEEISKIIFPPTGKASIISSNGAETANFAYSGELGENQSFHNINGIAKIGLQSPGNGEINSPKLNFGVATSPESDFKKPTEIVLSPEKAATSAVENVASKNLADASNIIFQQEKGANSSVYFWISLAALLGVLSAIIMFFLWKL